MLYSHYPTSSHDRPSVSFHEISDPDTEEDVYASSSIEFEDLPIALRKNDSILFHLIFYFASTSLHVELVKDTIIYFCIINLLYPYKLSTSAS